MADSPVQTNASDRRQVAHGRKREQTEVDRNRELWREQLSTKNGREFVWRRLRALGYLHHIGGTVEQVYGQAALHNEACLWLKAITEHRDLFLQMQNEALKRDALEQKDNERSRVATEVVDDGDEEFRA